MGVSVGCVLLSAFGGYVVTSLIFLRFPLILHKKKRVLIQAAHISHRGGAGERLENTIEAFKHALSQGTQMLELDCQITKDGQVLVSHDNDLSRSTGQDMQICDTCYDDLPPLKTELRVTFSGGDVCKTSCLAEKQRRFALLREVFTEFPDTPINIDIKIDNDELIHKIDELVREFEREHITVWGSMRYTVCNKLYSLNPNVSLFCSIRRVLLMMVQFYTGILPFIPIKERFLEVPMPKGLAKIKLGSEPISLKYRVILNIMDFMLINRVFLRHLQRRGIQVYLFVLNDEWGYERAFRLGADGVMTDYPTRLRKWLDKHPQYPTSSTR